jgi:hypothetical protein
MANANFVAYVIANAIEIRNPALPEHLIVVCRPPRDIQHVPALGLLPPHGCRRRRVGVQVPQQGIKALCSFLGASFRLFSLADPSRSNNMLLLKY